MRVFTWSGWRHARASEVWIRVRFDEKELTVIVEDDGRGFDPAAPVSGHGRENLQTRMKEVRGGGGLCLACDGDRDHSQSVGLHDADNLWWTESGEFQSAPASGRLLPAQRLAGDSESAASSDGLLDEPSAVDSLGSCSAACSPGKTHPAVVWFHVLGLRHRLSGSDFCAVL